MITDAPTLVFDLIIPQAADWPGYNFPIFGADGTPYDLTGCSARGEIRPYAGSDELYFVWSTNPTSGQGLISLDDSVVNIRTLATETVGWRWTEAEYDLILTNPGAPLGLRTSRIVMGNIAVSRAVTLTAA